MTVCSLTHLKVRQAHARFKKMQPVRRLRICRMDTIHKRTLFTRNWLSSPRFLRISVNHATLPKTKQSNQPNKIVGHGTVLHHWQESYAVGWCLSFLSIRFRTSPSENTAYRHKTEQWSIVSGWLHKWQFTYTKAHIHIYYWAMF